MRSASKGDGGGRLGRGSLRVGVGWADVVGRRDGVAAAVRACGAEAGARLLGERGWAKSMGWVPLVSSNTCVSGSPLASTPSSLLGVLGRAGSGRGWARRHCTHAVMLVSREKTNRPVRPPRLQSGQNRV